MRVYKLLQLVCLHPVSPGFVRWSQSGSPTFGNQGGVSFASFLLIIKVNTNSQMESPKVKVKVSQSCPTLCESMDCNSPWNSPGQNTGVGSLSLLQGILPTQGSNPGLPHCRRILYQLSHKEGPISWVKNPRSPTLLLHVILQVISFILSQQCLPWHGWTDPCVKSLLSSGYHQAIPLPVSPMHAFSLLWYG